MDRRFYEENRQSDPTPAAFEENLAAGSIIVREKTPFEKADSLKDTWPWLTGRQALLRIWAGIRQLCLLIISNTLFQAFIVLTIFANSITLALEDPSLDVQPAPYETMDLGFLYIYTIEMGLKVLALGLIFGEKTYLRDTWNVLDAVVVAAGWIELEYTNTGVNISALRALRILRPLRSITRIQGMKVVFSSLLGSVRLLLSAMALLMFYYLISGIGTLQMFMGTLKQHCVDLETGENTSKICGSETCDAGQACAKTLDNPNFGKSNFDNVFMAMVTVFQCVTLEGWTPIMVGLEKSVGMWIVALYIPIVYMGAFFFMNMTAVAMNSSVKTS